MQSEPNMDMAHLGHVELLTPTPDESLRFFVDVLGMDPKARATGNPFTFGLGMTTSSIP